MRIQRMLSITSNNNYLSPIVFSLSGSPVPLNSLLEPYSVSPWVRFFFLYATGLFMLRARISSLYIYIITMKKKNKSILIFIRKPH